MSCALDLQNPKRGILLGEIDTAYLWSADELPPQTDLCVLDEAQRVLSTTLRIPLPFLVPGKSPITSAPRGQFEWSYGGKEFLASYWSLPLKYMYFTPGWTVVLSESKAEVLAPLDKFILTFPLVGLLALLVVGLLSISQIRRSLVPLEKLQEGTRRIAMEDFDTRVLARSFNAMAERLGRQFNALKQFSWGTLTALARAIDAKSSWTHGHSERVTNLACELAAEMGGTEKDLDRIRRGGLLHDIGKIGTPVDVLDKPGKLTPEELKGMREHARRGAHILQPIPGFEEILPIVLQHHEHVDGSGYPEGLVGGAISLDARILAVADCYDAMASDRPYRAGLSREEVIGTIKEGAGRQFDPKVVEAFLRLIKQKEEKESKGAMALVPESSVSEPGASGPGEEGLA
jgi:putative nucleotidyltransferase with HDIG domain